MPVRNVVRLTGFRRGKRQGKYGVAPKAERTVNGKTFHSKKEAVRYLELSLLEKAGKIRDLVLQPRYPIDLDGAHICTYVADFEYYDLERMSLVVEDVKGFKTDIYKLKRKLFEASRKIKVTET